MDKIEKIRQDEAETSYDTQQYTPRPSVDIGDVARVQFASHAKVFDKKRKAVFDWGQFKEVAGIFYALGKKDSETKEKKQPDNSMEEAAEEYEKEHTYQRYDGGGLTPEYNATLAEAFIAGVEWQKNKDKEIIEVAEDHAFMAGSVWQEEQMLKGAMEGEVHPDDCEIWVNLVGYGYKFNDGDKVKIIIIKED